MLINRAHRSAQGEGKKQTKKTRSEGWSGVREGREGGKRIKGEVRDSGINSREYMEGRGRKKSTRENIITSMMINITTVPALPCGHEMKTE